MRNQRELPLDPLDPISIQDLTSPPAEVYIWALEALQVGAGNIIFLSQRPRAIPGVLAHMFPPAQEIRRLQMECPA